jgi:2-polyprenyl-3-methyl-5-hydroxy-6-metoxy-1,4-benzoquinol methylase
MKQKIYNAIIKTGIAVLSKVFPQEFGGTPIEATDRYVEVPFVLRNLPKPPAKVLDVGCSGSMFPLILQAIGYETTGIDQRPHEAKEMFHFVNADICVYSDTTKYDCITCISTLEHIGIGGRYGCKDSGKADYIALKNMAGKLKPKGYILMTIPIDDFYSVVKPYLRFYDYERVTDMLCFAGLKIARKEIYQKNNGIWESGFFREGVSIDDYPVMCLRLEVI